MKTCRQSTSSYTLDNSPPEKEPEEKYSTKYTPKLPEIVKDSSNSSKPKDMEETWADMDKDILRNDYKHIFQKKLNH